MSWLTQARRDVTMVARGLVGLTPSPLVARPPRAAARPVAGAARAVVIEAVTRETADAVSITLRDPSGAPLTFTPGQFFTIEATIAGERVRRAYSASSDPRDRDRATITVKRVAGGRMSTFLTEQARPGQALGLLGPSGDFALAPATAPRDVIAIAGGSGITPIMAITRAALADEPGARVTLIYGNRTRAAIIFADALADLAARYPGRLTIAHALDDVDGALTPATLAAHLDAAAPGAGAAYLLCGPDPMMALAQATLAERGVAADLIRAERFYAPARPSAPTAAQPVTIRRAGVVTRAIVRPGDTLLEAGLAAGVPLKLSCAMGGCGACAVTLVEGDVTMDEPNCLSAGERAGGKILACVARPTAPCTVEAPT
ncbi:MAG: ferredoxin--NADP reductase [Myxococcales bacterium]|nr:ferredoxin--NADP reductase [Myxococcales bacterium]